MSRTKIQGFLNTKYHPSKLGRGASNTINRSIVALLSDKINFTDVLLTSDVEKAIDEYLANEAPFIFGDNFVNDDVNGYQQVISSWVVGHVEAAGGLDNPKLAELILKSYFGDDGYVNYATYVSATDNTIIIKKIEPWENEKVYEYIVDKLKKASSDNDYSGFLENSFLSTLVSNDYTYEGFKKKVSENLSTGLKNGSLSVDINISNDFLNQGPISLVKDGSNMHLSKEFPSHDVTAAKTIPVDKIKEFKRITNWDNTVSVFGMPNSAPVDDSVTTFTNEQINKFADALVGKDLTKNQFLYYTGEIYDEVSVLLDSDFWLAGLDKYAKNQKFAWETLKENVSAALYTAGGVVAITTGVWTHALISSVGIMAGSNIAAIIGAAAVAPPPAPVATGWWASRATTLARAGGWILRTIASPTAWLIAFNAAWIIGLFVSFAQARKDASHEDRLEMLLSKKYASFLVDAVVALINGRGVGDSFRTKAKDLTFLRRVLTVFGIDKEVERRVILWNRFSFELSRDENFLDSDESQLRHRHAVDDAISKGLQANIPLPDITKLTDEQIQDRQRFYKQCALMMNLSKLAAPYEEHIIERQKF